MRNRLAVFALIALIAVCACAQTATPTKVGIVDIQRAVTSTDEGKRSLEALNKKYEPRQAALQKQRTEIEELAKQLRTSDKMTNEARSALLKNWSRSKSLCAATPSQLRSITRPISARSWVGS